MELGKVFYIVVATFFILSLPSALADYHWYEEYYDWANSCIRSNPTVTVSPSSQSADAGSSATYSVTITNNDNSNCDSSIFTPSFSGIVGGLSVSSEAVSIAAGSSRTVSLTVDSSTTDSSGNYYIGVEFSNSDDFSYSSSQTITYSLHHSHNSHCTRANPIVSVSPSSQKISPAGQVSFTVTVTNKDSSECGSSVFVSQLIDPPGIATMFSPIRLNIEPGSSATSQLTAMTTSSVQSGTYTLNIGFFNNAESSYKGSAVALLTVDTSCVKSNPTVSVSPSYQLGNAGSSFSLSAEIRNNDANCAARNFDVQASVPSGWITSFDPIITLKSGETRTLTFSVQTPTYATGQRTVTVTATSEGFQGSGSSTIELQQPQTTCRVRINSISLTSNGVDSTVFILGDTIKVSALISVTGVDPLVTLKYYVDDVFYDSTTANIPVGTTTTVIFNRLIRTADFGARDPTVKVVATAPCDSVGDTQTKFFAITSATAKGTLQVRVYDSTTGTGISSARVDATSAVVDPTAFTDFNGYATLTLDPGTYTVTISAPNYLTRTTTTSVYSGQTTTISVGLDRTTAAFTCQLSLVESRINNPSVVKGNNLDVFVKLKMTFPSRDPTAQVTVNVERPTVDPAQTKTFFFPYSGSTDEKTFSFSTWDLQTGAWNVYVDAVGESNCGTLSRTFIGSANILSTATSTVSPTANAGPDVTVSQGQSVTLSAGSSYDPDGSIVSYEWRESGTFLSSSVSFTTTFGVGTHYITLIVRDNSGLTASDTVVVTVTSTTRIDPPEFRFSTYNIPLQAIEGSTVTFSATVTNDGPDPGSSVVRFFVDNSERCVSNINLAVGGSTTQTCNWSATAGNHQVIIRIDPAPYEVNTANNEVSSAISVSAQQTSQQQSTQQPSQPQQSTQTVQYQSQSVSQPVPQQTSYPTTTVYQAQSTPFSVSTPADTSQRVQDISSTAVSIKSVPSLQSSLAAESRAIVVQTFNYEGVFVLVLLIVSCVGGGITVFKLKLFTRFFRKSSNLPETF